MAKLVLNRPIALHCGYNTIGNRKCTSSCSRAIRVESIASSNQTHIHIRQLYIYGIGSANGTIEGSLVIDAISRRIQMRGNGFTGWESARAYVTRAGEEATASTLGEIGKYNCFHASV